MIDGWLFPPNSVAPRCTWPKSQYRNPLGCSCGVVAASSRGSLLDSKERATQEGMKHAYLGWIDRDGLKGFQPETESVDRFLNRLRHQHDRNMVGIWSVLDTEVIDAIGTNLCHLRDHRAVSRHDPGAIRDQLHAGRDT